MSRLDSGKMSEALDQLEHALAALWVPEEGALPKARVCMGNLVFLAGVSGRERSVELLDALRAAETSRTFLVTIDPKLPPWALDAQVSARCQREGERLLCSERIDLTLGAGAIDRASSVITSLLLPEIPSTLVILEPAPAMLVTALARGASRLVIDSDAIGIETSVEIARATSAHLADLAWMRIYPWRNQIAGAFDDPQVRPAVSALQRLAVTTTGSHPLPPVTRLLVGWMASRLGWTLQNPSCAIDGRHQRILLDLQGHAVVDAPPGRLLSVEISALLGEARMLLDLAREPHGATLQVACTTEGLGASVAHITLAEPPLQVLLDRALDDANSDLALRQALHAAALLLGPTPS
ncbi:MAG: glucose-6-phosphate dehydrogenase assembly protein OpcA [Polyangiaceae bacterium]|nr:glucose-6-phosphate dehydrogenase assembly protein OpcA [Polyangiaceae bacterium]